MNIRHLDGRYTYAAAAAMSPGDIVTRPDGSLAWFDGLEDAAIGDFVSPQPLKAPMTIDVAAKSTDTFSAGDDVYWDASEEEVTSTDTDNTLIGTAITAKASGVTTLHVSLTL